MSNRHSKANNATIHQYFTRQNSTQSKAEGSTVENSTSEKSVLEKMPDDDVSNKELKALIMGLEGKIDQKLDQCFEKISERVDKLNEKVENLEVDVVWSKKAQGEDHTLIIKMADEIAELKQSLLHTQLYSRKYHLLVYGVEGFESTTPACIERVRRFAVDNLKLEEKFAKNMVIRNAYRLQKRDTGATPIIVVFLLWAERDAFLRAGKNLSGTKMSVRTDLPPELKKKRGELAHRAYEIRRDRQIHARVQERGVDIWIETRNSGTQPWRRWAE
jgi:hypothetical protein